MKLLGWTVERGDNRRVVGRVSEFLTLRVDVPTFYAYREPRYGALWGGRLSDVQAGSPRDLAHQLYLNRQERLRRQRVLVMIRVRDNITPVMVRMSEQFRVLEATAATAARAMAGFGRSYDTAARQHILDIMEGIE